MWISERVEFGPKLGGFRAHLVLGGLIAYFTSTMFCLIAIMDNPYRGDFSISPNAFQLIYDGLMKKPAI